MKNNKKYKLPNLTLRRGLFLMLAASTLILLSYKSASAQEKNRVVHLAKLQIDSAQLENYKALLKEGIETAIRVEPGVLTLYAVYEKDRPTHVTVFEIYADTAAYKALYAAVSAYISKTVT
jgi:quinol monooxygenase YgiN